MCDRWAKGNIYTAFHVLLGAVSTRFPLLGLLFIGYQMSQLILDRRFFVGLFYAHSEPGNSALHTVEKLTEFAFGYALFTLWNISSRISF